MSSKLRSARIQTDKISQLDETLDKIEIEDDVQIEGELTTSGKLTTEAVHGYPDQDLDITPGAGQNINLGGPVTAPTPTEDNHVATKQYADASGMSPEDDTTFTGDITFSGRMIGPSSSTTGSQTVSGGTSVQVTPPRSMRLAWNISNRFRYVYLGQAIINEEFGWHWFPGNTDVRLRNRFSSASTWYWRQY